MFADITNRVILNVERFAENLHIDELVDYKHTIQDPVIKKNKVQKLIKLQTMQLQYMQNFKDSK